MCATLGKPEENLMFLYSKLCSLERANLYSLKTTGPHEECVCAAAYETGLTVPGQIVTHTEWT